MEKRRPTYDLGTFKAAVAADRAGFRRTAMHNARALGFGHEDMKAALATMNGGQFVKSMTSYADHRL